MCIRMPAFIQAKLSSGVCLHVTGLSLGDEELRCRLVLPAAFFGYEINDASDNSHLILSSMLPEHDNCSTISLIRPRLV
jgi:hypothetical protein